MEAFERRLRNLESRVQNLEQPRPLNESSSGDDCTICSNTLRFLRSVQGEVEKLRNMLPTADEMHSLRRQVSTAQSSLDELRYKQDAAAASTHSLSHSLKQVHSKVDATRTNLPAITPLPAVQARTDEAPRLRAEMKNLHQDLQTRQDSWMRDAEHKIPVISDMPKSFCTLESAVRDQCDAMESSLKENFAKLESRWSEKCSVFILEVHRLMDSKLDVSSWEEWTIDTQAEVKTLRDMISSLHVELEGGLSSFRQDSMERDRRVDGQLGILSRDFRRVFVRGKECGQESLEGTYTEPIFVDVKVEDPFPEL